ncbi:hypothetical protein Tco_0890678 [Tanacetum coccineum]|uniref:Tf2-1-like SH3-like domain-containing protein n=1 Tax=Tanacetum coccineum TaxID=301880 RepID=A0ABQ5C147_9ASTR
MLKVSPWKGVVRFGKKGKLAPRFVGPFEILERIGPVAYRLRLPEELSSVHDTFHVSNLKKCLADAKICIVSLDEIKVDKTLRFVEEPLEIMDREVKTLKRSKIPIVKVRWNSKRGPEFTWEREDHMKAKFFARLSEGIGICFASGSPKAHLPYGMFLTRLFLYVMEYYPHLDNGIYNVIDRVMRPLALRQTPTPQSDRGIPKACDSVSSSSTHHFGSSSHQEDDDNHERTS